MEWSANRREHSELVVQMAAFVDVVRLEGDLQAAAAHPEGHRIHVHLTERARSTR